MRGKLLGVVALLASLAWACATGVEPDPSLCEVQADSTGIVSVPDSVLAHCLTVPRPEAE